MPTDIEQAKQIVSSSGNNFHTKVLQYLESEGWTIIISPYYNDNYTNKPREIDLIAEKAFNQEPYGTFLGTVNVQLFIECKYLAQKTVFWCHDKNRENAKQLVVKDGPFTATNRFIEQHHYLNSCDKVAKLFASERGQAQENDPFYKALNQSLNSLIYFKNHETFIQLPESYRDYERAYLKFPVIICNSFDNLFQVDMSREDDPVQIEENFQLEVNYAYTDNGGGSHNEYFLIDVVDFGRVNTFLTLVENDANHAGMLLER